MNDSTKLKISLSLKNKYSNDIEYQKMMDKAHFIHSKKMLGNIPWNKGLTKNTDSRVENLGIKVSKSLKDKYMAGFKSNMLGTHRNAETKKKIGLKVKERWDTYTDAERTTLYKKIFHRREMSNPEKEFQKFIEDNNLPYIFVGNVQNKVITINNKIPDFIHVNENKIIEIYGDYYHANDNPQDLIMFYKDRGYSCLIIWASELKKSNILEKVLNFSKQGDQLC